MRYDLQTNLSPQIKICGINDSKTAMAAIESGVNYLGFVLSMPQTARYVTTNQAQTIITSLQSAGGKPNKYGTNTDHGFCRVVGVFVDEEREFVERAADICSLDVVQLHGCEPAWYCQYLRSKGYEVWKSFRMKDEKVLEQIREYIGKVDALHLDAYSADRVGGGLAKSFDWEWAVQAKRFSTRLVLAGGLNSSNIQQAISKVQPEVVDVSSGVETIVGQKDIGLIKTFVSMVKKCNTLSIIL
ncbi:MAG TPA: phosphoribosylanthranilate isomerase [Candidatus Wirthbacteria bacterium]|nr:phosphoribosylanthranilate isomerase [Candidatus Wirthbacteria bacterium]